MTTATRSIAAPVASPALQAALLRPLPANSSILLVDDDPINQMLVGAFLQTLGYTEVQVATDGAQALALCARHDFGLVLMDCLMPVMDGLEATRRLRAGGFARPILALTANADPQDIQRCLDAGMDGHLAKPVDIQCMAILLRQWLGGPQPATAAAPAPVPVPVLN